MSERFLLQTINKTNGKLFLGGTVSSSAPNALAIQLTDAKGTQIPCKVRTTRNEDAQGSAFVLFARVEEDAPVVLTVSDGAGSDQVTIDAAYMNQHKRSGLRSKLNPRNIAKAKKFLRERGLKNTLLRVNSEVKKDEEDLDYNLWKQFCDPTKEELKEQRNAWKSFSFEGGNAPLISIVIPAYNTDRKMLSHLLDSIKDQTYPVFEVLIADGSPEENHTVKETLDAYTQSDSRFIYVPVGGNKGISGNTNAGLAAATGDFIAFCDHDDALPPWALFEVVKAISENPRVQFLYTDEDKVDEEGRDFFDPHFKSDFNLFLLETCNYISHLNVVRKGLLEKAGFLNGEYDGSQDYDFVLRCAEILTAEENARLECYRTALKETTDAKVLAEQSGLLEDSVQKLLEGRFVSELAVHVPKVCYHWRTSRASTAFDSKAKSYASEAGCRALLAHQQRLQTDFLVVENSPVFGFYRTRYPKTTEENVLLLDNHLILKDNNYLYEMRGLLKRENVGAVGARIVDKNGATWSAGQIITKEDLSAAAFAGLFEYQGSYMHRMMCLQNYSSLDGACLLLRRSLWERLGGLDKTFRTDLAYTDLCLRIRQLGYLLVYTPYAVAEIKDTMAKPANAQEWKEDAAYFRKKWAGFLEHTDPYYNPQFLPDKAGFHIGISLDDLQDKLDS